MFRVRIRYTKEDRVRFVSARDLTAVWERALRRAGLPIRYSEGYNPHPKVSFPDALPVGVASTGEYAELTFEEPIDLAPAMSSLSATLPDGMTILTYRHVEHGAPKLASMLEATLWETTYDVRPNDPDHVEDTVAILRRLGERVLAADTAPVTRHRPDSDPKTVDIRPALVAVHATAGASPVRLGIAEPGGLPHPTIRAILRNDGPSVRPTDLHDVLLAHAAEDIALPDPRNLRRVVQGHLADRGLHEALSGEFVPLDPSPVAVAR